MSAAETTFSSELSIEYERQFIKVAQSWAVEFVQALGAPSEISFRLSLLIEESLLFIIDKYPDRSGNPDLHLRLALTSSGALEVEIDDIGPPIPSFLASPEQLANDPSLGLWLKIARGHAKDFEFINRGKDGWQIRFSLTSDGWLLPARINSRPEQRADVDLSGLAARPVMPSDTAEIARLTYATYRYSYQHPDIYNLEEYARKLTQGQYDVSVVPLNEKLVGMAAIKYGGVFERGAEAGALMVDPEFRGRGVRQLLDGFLEYKYQENPRNVDFFYGYQVTQHDKSQRGADPGEPNYFCPTSFFLNKNPAIKFIGLNSTELSRDSSIEVFMALKPLAIKHLYIPSAQHRNIIKSTIADLNIDPELKPADGQAVGTTELSSYEHDTARYASIEVSELGADWITALTSELISLLGKGNVSIRILIDATKDYPAELHPFMQGIGAGFCGMSLMSCDRMSVSYVVATDPVGFDNIVVYRESARQLLDFIKAHWPGKMA